MNMWFTLGGLAVGIVSLLYAIVVDRQKAHLRRLIRTVVADLERGLADVEDNVTLGLEHIDKVREFMNTLRRSEALPPQLDRVAWAEADVTSAHRILKNLRKNLASLRIELFEGKARGAPPRETANEEL